MSDKPAFRDSDQSDDPLSNSPGDSRGKEALESLSREIKVALKLKKQCTRQLSLCIKNNEDQKSHKREMEEIKNRLKKLRAAKLALENELDGQGGKNVQESDYPSRFTYVHSNDLTDSANINVVRFSKEYSTEWDEFVRRHPHATPYHYCSIRNVIKEVFDKDDYSLMATNNDGEITGVLPLTRLKSIGFGDFLVSVPYFNYGGPLSNCNNIENALLEQASVDCQKQQIEHMEIRETRERDNWPVKKNKVCMLLKLPSEYGYLEEKLGSKLRAQLNRAERENVNVKYGRLELIKPFYEVFTRNMRDLGTPVYGIKLFYALMNVTEIDTQIIVIELDNKPVAAAFLIGYRDTLEIPWASTLREVNKFSINMYLYRKVLEYAIEKGYGYFDFGRSSIDSGTYRFKRQWGAKPLQTYWHYWLNEGESLPQLNPDNPKYKLLVNIWKKLPLIVTTLLGPGIVKNLP